MPWRGESALSHVSMISSLRRLSSCPTSETRRPDKWENAALKLFLISVFFSRSTMWLLTHIAAEVTSSKMLRNIAFSNLLPASTIERDVSRVPGVEDIDAALTALYVFNRCLTTSLDRGVSVSSWRRIVSLATTVVFIQVNSDTYRARSVGKCCVVWWRHQWKRKRHGAEAVVSGVTKPAICSTFLQMFVVSTVAVATESPDSFSLPADDVTSFASWSCPLVGGITPRRPYPLSRADACWDDTTSCVRELMCHTRCTMSLWEGVVTVMLGQHDEVAARHVYVLRWCDNMELRHAVQCDSAAVLGCSLTTQKRAYRNSTI